MAKNLVSSDQIKVELDDNDLLLKLVQDYYTKNEIDINNYTKTEVDSKDTAIKESMWEVVEIPDDELSQWTLEE